MNYFKSGILAVIILYFIYGIFFPHLPLVNADELWETSRAYFLKTMHHPGEPLIPESVSPFYASLGKIGWKSWCIATAKSGSFAFMMKLLPVSELTAMRLTMFCWSVLACLLTYFLARKLDLPKWFALFSVALLIAFPDFFSQIHRERSEILICGSLVAALLLFITAIKSRSPLRKKMLFFCTGIFSWLPSCFIHPSAILIPACIGILYLVFEQKNLISVNTLLIGIGLAGGALFFLMLMNAMKEYAVAAGGGNYFNYQGPPILLKPLRYFLKLPYAFYNRFLSVNIFSRPVSFLIFILSMIILFRSRFSLRKYLPNNTLIIIFIPIVVSLLVLYFLSGSFGNYNVIIAPLVTITIAFFVKYISSEKISVKYLTYSSLILLFIFLTNASSIGKDIKYAHEYQRMTAEVRSAIPDEAPVLGLALYYNPFKDQAYYSNSWFNQYAGRSTQSFEEAVKALKASYIILDDAFVGRALLDRGNAWTDSMMSFIANNGKVIKEFPVVYDAGNRVPAPETFPSSWKYNSQQKGFIKKIKIIKLSS